VVGVVDREAGAPRACNWSHERRAAPERQVAAFADPGGYLATECLNSTFVPDAVRQVG
jgi:hypothetical protein